jgi:hypothetical protein
VNTRARRYGGPPFDRPVESRQTENWRRME